MSNVKYYITLARKLALHEVSPAKIVGTGYKNSREAAYEYLTRMIAAEYALEEHND